MRVRAPGWPASSALVVALGAATWPVWGWYVTRVSDGSDEPWGILALASLLLILCRAWRENRSGTGVPDVADIPRRQLVPATICLGLYVTTFWMVPPLGRAFLALGAAGSLVLPRGRSAGMWGLLLLSLPVVATLQFYLGYPLRVLAAEASARSLFLCGFSVIREGTLLNWNGEAVMVDAPCSGVRMLWFGLYLACVLAAVYRLAATRTIWCAVAAVFLVIAANVIRAIALFFKEARIVHWPEWTHAGVGLVLFAAAAWIIKCMAERLQGGRSAT